MKISMLRLPKVKQENTNKKQSNRKKSNKGKKNSSYSKRQKKCNKLTKRCNSRKTTNEVAYQSQLFKIKPKNKGLDHGQSGLMLKEILYMRAEDSQAILFCFG